MPRTLPAIKREHVEAFVVSLQDAGQRPATVSIAYRSLPAVLQVGPRRGRDRGFADGADERKADAEEPPAILRDKEAIKAILDAYAGADFDARIGTRVIRLLLDTGMRRAELAGLKVDDINLDQQVAIVMGKGRRPRACPFSNKTAQALDRYVRLRLAHPFADRPELWLARKGVLTDSGVLQVLRRRGATVGLPKLHPHQFRHTYAHLWLSDGGNKGDLMRLAGWKSRQMRSRFGASAADERAREAYQTAEPRATGSEAPICLLLIILGSAASQTGARVRPQSPPGHMHTRTGIPALRVRILRGGAAATEVLRPAKRRLDHRDRKLSSNRRGSSPGR